MLWESPKRTVAPRRPRLRVGGIPETINCSREIDVRPGSGPGVNRQLAAPRATSSAVSLELGGVDGHSGGLFPGAHLKQQRKRAKRRITKSKRKQEEKYETKKTDKRKRKRIQERDVKENIKKKER
jgi:hypothetical protein